MKILCFADLHHESEDYFHCLSGIDDMNYDIAISIGDNSYYDFEKIRKYINGDIYGILGNHDSFRTLEDSGIIDFHNKIIVYEGIKIAGFCGSYKYKCADFPSFTQEESEEILGSMEKADILISHEGPFNLYGSDLSHCGFKGITEYICKYNIPLNIHGHYHKNTVSKLNNAVILGLHGIAIVNTENFNVNLIKE